MTVPEQMMHPLDQKIVERNYQSHSQAVVDMINKHVIAGHTEHNAVKVDISILLYDVSWIYGQWRTTAPQPTIYCFKRG